MSMQSPESETVDQEAASSMISVQRRNLIFIAVLLGMLLAALDGTIVATALPTVVADLGDAGHQSWVVTSYLLASTVATAVMGKFGDLFGRRAVFMTCIVIFAAGSLLCGMAGSMAVLVGARAIQGLGSGGLMVTATALIGEIIPMRERGRYQGMLGAVFGVTTVIGPLLGGLFTDHLGWRWAFYINLPISVVVIVVAAGAIPALAKATRPVIDYWGIVLIGLGASALTLATSWGGTTYPWSSPMIIGLFVGSVAAIVLFVWVESRVSEPILPPRLFRDPVFTICCVLSFVVGFAMLGVMTYLPTFMQFVNGVSATASGLRTLPMVAGMLITSTGTGILVGRTGKYKRYPVAGTATMAIALVLLSRMDNSTPFILQSLYLLILGIGIGASMQVLTLIVQNTARFDDLGVATSGVTFFRTIGSSFGAAIFGSLFSNFLAREISSVKVPPEATQSPQALHALPHETAIPVINAYADSLDLVFLCATPVAVIGFVVALFLKEVPLRDTDSALAADMGEGFGMPNSVSPDKLLEIAISNAMRGFPHIGLRKLREHAGVSMPIAPLWALVQANRFLRATGSAEVSRIAQWYRIPPEVIDPAFNELVANGYALRTNDHVWLTDPGRQEVDKISEAINQYLVERLSRTPDFEDRADREQIQAALERISRRIVTDTDWRENPISALPTASGTSPAR